MENQCYKTYDDPTEPFGILQVSPYGLSVSGIPGQVEAVGNCYFTMTNGWHYMYD